MKKILLRCAGVVFYLMICFSASAQDIGSEVGSALDHVEKQLLNVLADTPDQNRIQNRAIRETVSVLDVKDEPLESVVAKISDLTGVVFILPDHLEERISLFIENINVWDLLKIILQFRDLAYYRTEGAVHIMHKDVFRQRHGQDFAVSLPSKIVSIRYANMEAMIVRVETVKSPDGKVWVDTKNRQIIMIDTPEKIASMRELIALHDLDIVTEEFDLRYVAYDRVHDALDKIMTPDAGRLEYRKSEGKIIVSDTKEKIQEVRAFLEKQDKKSVIPLRVKIMRVALSEEHAHGIDWEAIVSDYQTGVLRVNGGINEDISEQLRIGTVTQEDYEILIDALDTVGELTHLIAFDFKPVLNQEGTLDIDTNDPFWSLRPGVRRDQDGPVILDGNGFEMRMNFVIRQEDQNLYLEMTPRLHWMDQDGMADAHTEYVFRALDKIHIGFNLKDVIVIGGLIRTEEISRTRKFPFLGDLPVVGSVFRMERRRYANTEYVVFLVPEEK